MAEKVRVLLVSQNMFQTGLLTKTYWNIAQILWQINEK